MRMRRHVCVFDQRGGEEYKRLRQGETTRERWKKKRLACGLEKRIMSRAETHLQPLMTVWVNGIR